MKLFVLVMRKKLLLIPLVLAPSVGCIHVPENCSVSGVEDRVVVMPPLSENARDALLPPTERNRAISRGLRPGESFMDCFYPPAADTAAVDDGFAEVNVAISVEGNPEWVQILRDSGYGFGATAAYCVMVRKFKPAVDAQGNPIRSRTFVRIRFTR